MELRSMLQSIFQKPENRVGLSRIKLLDGYSNDYIPWDGNALKNATVVNCIDTICKHASKLHPHHIVRKNGTIIENRDDNLQYLLDTRPNWLMTSSEFLEKIIAQYYLSNNLFVYIQRNAKGTVTALWPVKFNDLQLLEDKEGAMYAKFTFGSGEETTVPYEELIHIRRHYNEDEVFGNPDNYVLKEDLNLLSSVKVAIINVVRNFNKLRGIINLQGVVRPEDQDTLWKKFVDSFAGPSNGSGIGIMDNRGTFQQLTTDNQTFDSSTMDFARDNIYQYFGISKDMVSGKYKEEDYQAFYESVIAPIAKKLSEEFTHKLFTQKERGFGNEIVFETNRFSYMSTASKVKIAAAMIPAGAIKRNEIRELFGYAGLPGKEGEEIVVSLNYVKSSDQSLYQTGKDSNTKGGDDNEPKNDDA